MAEEKPSCLRREEKGRHKEEEREKERERGVRGYEKERKMKELEEEKVKKRSVLVASLKYLLSTFPYLCQSHRGFTFTIYQIFDII